MIRFTTATLLFLGFTATATAQQSPLAMPISPTLRADVLVSSNVVRVGDLVDNAGASASVAVFRAPDLGTTGSVPTARIVEALRAQNVIGVDTGGITAVSVTRASRAIGTAELQSHIAHTLTARYGLRNADNLSVTFDRDIRTIHIDPAQKADLAAVRMSYEPRGGRFDITFETGTGTHRTPLRVTGIAVEIAEAAVVTRPITRGDVLRESDIAIERRPKTEVTSDTLNDVQDVIGLAARQGLKAGQVIRRSDLTKPELVQRNEQIIMIFQQPGMSLTLRGKSLDSGTEGDTVNVVNLQSKRTLQGVVTGPNEVTIMSLAPRATTNVAAFNQSGAVARP